MSTYDRLIQECFMTQGLYQPSIIAAALAFIAGWIWYGPLCGKCYLEALGKNPEDCKGKKMDMLPLLTTFLGWVIAALVYGVLVQATGIHKLNSKINLALLIWIGFSLPGIVAKVMYGNHQRKLILIDAGYTLVSYIIIALVYTYWHNLMA